MSAHNQRSDRHASGRLLCGKFRRGRSHAFPNGALKCWRETFRTSPPRRASAVCCVRIRKVTIPTA